MIDREKHPTITRRRSLVLLGSRLAEAIAPFPEPTTPHQRRAGRFSVPIIGGVAGAVSTSMLAKEPKEIPVAVVSGAVIGFIFGAAFDKYFGITD